MGYTMHSYLCLRHRLSIFMPISTSWYLFILQENFIDIKINITFLFNIFLSIKNTVKKTQVRIICVKVC